MRIDVQRERSDAQQFLCALPIVKNKLAVDGETVISAVFAGGGNKQIECARRCWGVITSPTRGECVIGKDLFARRAKINMGLGAGEDRSTLQILTCEMLGFESFRFARRSRGERCLSAISLRVNRPGL